MAQEMAQEIVQKIWVIASHGCRGTFHYKKKIILFLYH